MKSLKEAKNIEYKDTNELNNNKIIDITEVKEIVKLRDKFVTEYCELKGFDKNNLTFEQVLEIRKQKGWKIKNNNK